MQDCIFCKVVAGELPCYKIYEDDLFLGILDIYPVKKGHSLIISKKHFRWAHEVEPYGEYWLAARRVARAIQNGLSPEWTQFFTHGLIPHAHIHIIPRYDPIEDSPAVPPEMPKLQLSKEEFEEIAEKIKSNL